MQSKTWIKESQICKSCMATGIPQIKNVLIQRAIHNDFRIMVLGSTMPILFAKMVLQGILKMKESAKLFIIVTVNYIVSILGACLPVCLPVCLPASLCSKPNDNKYLG